MGEERETLSETVGSGSLLAVCRGKIVVRRCDICQVNTSSREAYCPGCTAKIRDIKKNLFKLELTCLDADIAQSVRRHWRYFLPRLMSISSYAAKWETTTEGIIHICSVEGLTVKGTARAPKDPYYLPVATVIFLDMLLASGVVVPPVASTAHKAHVRIPVRSRCQMCPSSAAGTLPLCVRHYEVWIWMCNVIGAATYVLPLRTLGRNEPISLGSLALLTGGKPHEVVEDAKVGYLPEIKDQKAPISPDNAWRLLRRFIAAAEELKRNPNP